MDAYISIRGQPDSFTQVLAPTSWPTSHFSNGSTNEQPNPSNDHYMEADAILQGSAETSFQVANGSSNVAGPSGKVANQYLSRRQQVDGTHQQVNGPHHQFSGAQVPLYSPVPTRYEQLGPDLGGDFGRDFYSAMEPGIARFQNSASNNVENGSNDMGGPVEGPDNQSHSQYQFPSNPDWPWRAVDSTAFDPYTGPPRGT